MIGRLTCRRDGLRGDRSARLRAKSRSEARRFLGSDIARGVKTREAAIPRLATDEAREWWGGMWADRILQSALTTQLLESQRTTLSELQTISDAFRAWTSDEDGWFSLLHGELLARP